MAFSTPRDLFLFQLSTMYDAEKKIVQMLGDVSNQVQDEKLAGLLRLHEQETRQQVTNLEQCFQELGVQPQKATCAAVDGIRKDYEQIASQQPSTEVLNMAALAGSLQIEHFEVATYRGLVDKAMLMGEAKCAQILETNLVQEEETAGKLTRVGHDMGQQFLAAV